LLLLFVGCGFWQLFLECCLIGYQWLVDVCWFVIYYWLFLWLSFIAVIHWLLFDGCFVWCALMVFAGTGGGVTIIAVVVMIAVDAYHHIFFLHMCAKNVLK